ncbi:straightjacket isoform c [Anaeramoeba ignava]|uniref:Straightjacket isoform c n=1 Tax=Anaeramoeba ignava TaxID=1746090 RepID=A0A9Q0LAQ3_ANAIG|nr:straightjacket isoform c [Anaeramoeba ignava]|eukprot:Anaeramoba_ignava/a347969_247.p1 GENE.a347969_247~~a347969_247.p1  ORF type:complete len:465 (-),score=139.45 a347969_247:47-1420(-)
MFAISSGAKDTTNFRLNLQQSNSFDKSSITYHGLFYEYYFNTGKPETEKTVAVEPFYAVTPNIYTNEKEYYISLALKSKYDGEGIKKFGRSPLNCVIILDISGSMNSPFYGRDDGEERSLSKLEVAKRTILGLFSHFHDTDYFGLVLFDTSAYVAWPYTQWGKIDKSKLEKKVKELRTKGGTNMEVGYNAGADMIRKYLKEEKDSERLKLCENRVMFLTDAHPNSGATSPQGLFSLTKKNADDKIYSTFIGVGVDFNTGLIDTITNTKGANYFAVHSSSEFKRRMETDFDYIVTTIAFDLKVKVDGAKILGAYGSPDADPNKETTVTEMCSVMPSNIENNETQGGIFLLKMDPSVADGIPVKITVSYQDRFGENHTDVHTTSFPELPDDQSTLFQDSSVRKAIFLVRYVDFLKEFTRNDENLKKGKQLLDYLNKEIPEIGDDKLKREVEALQKILDN